MGRGSNTKDSRFKRAKGEKLLGLDEMPPTILDLSTIQITDERSLPWTRGLGEQPHPGFQWFAVSLSAVAPDASGDDVFPVCLTTAISGNNVIHIEFLGRKGATAILTTVAVSLE